MPAEICAKETPRGGGGKRLYKMRRRKVAKLAEEQELLQSGNIFKRAFKTGGIRETGGAVTAPTESRSTS